MLARHKCVAARGNMGVLATDTENQILVWLCKRDERIEGSGQLLPLLRAQGANRNENLLYFRRHRGCRTPTPSYPGQCEPADSAQRFHQLVDRIVRGKMELESGT